ncbi:MAG: YbhN family protein [Nitrospinota bacterium]
MDVLIREGKVQSAAADASGKRRRASWWRWAVSLAVFVIVLRWIDLDDFQSALSLLRWWALLLGFVFLTVALVLFRALRLWLFLRAQGCPIRFGKTCNIQWAGLFFGLFLPGTLGTDAWRVWAISQSEGQIEGALAAIAMDRVVGFVGLIATVLLAWAIYGGTWSGLEAGGILLGAGLFCVALLTGFGLLSSPRVTGSLTRLPVLRTRKVKEVLSGVQASLLLLRRRSGWLLIIFGITIAGHVVNICAVFVLARGIGVGLGFGYYLALIPLVFVAAGLPISFSGLGVRDLTYVSIFQRLGVPAEIMLAVSVAEFGLTLLIRLLGGLFYMFSGGDAAAAGVDKSQEPA